jgi:ketosteroid isomerase-like protein
MKDGIDRRSFAAMGLAGGAALLGGGASAEPPVAADRERMLAEIVEARRHFADVLLRHDHGALFDLFTSDTLVLPSGGPLVRGRDAAVAFWTAATSDPARRLRSAFEAVDSMFEGDVVIEVGLATVSAVQADGREEIADHGKYIVVWKPVDGRWKRHRDIFNSDGARA